MRRFVAPAVLVASLAACEGPAGEMGPVGPQGPGGPGTRIVLSATVAADGSASVAMPAAAGSLANPPGLTCYIGTGNSFLLVGTDLEGPVCGISQAPGNLVAEMEYGVPGWTARFVVVY